MKSDEAFREAVYRKRDRARRERTTRRRIAAITVPLAFCLLCGAVWLSAPPLHSAAPEASPLTDSSQENEAAMETRPLVESAGSNSTLPPASAAAAVRVETVQGQSVYQGGAHDAEIRAMLKKLTPGNFPQGDPVPSGKYRVIVHEGASPLTYCYDGTRFFYEEEMGWMELDESSAEQFRQWIGIAVNS